MKWETVDARQEQADNLTVYHMKHEPENNCWRIVFRDEHGEDIALKVAWLTIFWNSDGKPVDDGHLKIGDIVSVVADNEHKVARSIRFVTRIEDAVKQAVEFARDYLGDKEDATYVRRRIQIKAFLESVGKNKVSELSAAEAERFVREIDRLTFSVSHDEVRSQLPEVLTEHINALMMASTTYGICTAQDFNIEDIEASIKKQENARRGLETIIWGLLI